MITLFHRNPSRSSGIVWLLEELEVPYETKEVTIRNADGTGAVDAANPHPHGKVPALTDGGATLFEGGAIALYLTDRYRAKKTLGPAPNDPGRGEFLSWLFYRPGVMEPAMMERRAGFHHIPGAMGWSTPDEMESFVNRHLTGRKYVVGDDFSAADIMVGGMINFAMQFKMMTETPVLKDYCARITDRPAFRKSMGMS